MAEARVNGRPPWRTLTLGLMLPMGARGQARRVLFAFGNELAGDALTDLVVVLLDAADTDPDRPHEDIIEMALEQVTDGPIALVAQEPDLACRPLEGPATTTNDAAHAALAAWAGDLLAMHASGAFASVWKSSV